MPDCRYEIRVQVSFVQQFQECQFRIEVGSDLRALDLLTAVERNPPRPPATDQYFRHRRIHADLDTFSTTGSCDRFRDHSHPPPHKTPEPAMSAHSAHAVMQQNIGGAWRARAAVGPYHSISRERNLDLRRFEPLIQKIRGALGENPNQ